MKELINSLLYVNCAFLHKPEARNPETTELRCYSKECMMNAHQDIANDIQSKGCKIFTSPEVQGIVNRNKATL